MSRPDYLAVTAVSHDGMLRDHNEDSLLVGPWTTCAVSTQSPQTLVFPLGSDPVVVAVADGLGGHPAGELASSVVVESLARIAGLLRDEQTVREAVDTVTADDEEAAARALVDKKLRSMRGLPTDVALRRLAGTLARKGFAPGLAFRIAREVLAEPHTRP